MKPEDKAEFAQLILTTANQYNRTFTNSFLEIYWQCLELFSLMEVQNAFFEHFKNTDSGRYMPQPSDILRVLQGDSQTQALKAWTKVKGAIRQVGSYHSIVFDDFLIHAVIRDMEGWIALCQKSEKELTFVSLEFQKRYSGYLLRRPPYYSSHLIGLFEHYNQINQQNTAEPLLFGNQQAALLTYLEGCKPGQLLDRQITPLNQLLLSDKVLSPSSKNAGEETTRTSHSTKKDKS